MKVIISDKEEEEIKMADIDIYFILRLFLIIYICISILINLIYIKIIKKLLILNTYVFFIY